MRHDRTEGIEILTRCCSATHSRGRHDNLYGIDFFIWRSSHTYRYAQ